MPERATIDMVAAARVARRVDLQEIWLSELSVRRNPGPVGTMRAEYVDDHIPMRHEDGVIELQSSYEFKVWSGEIQVAEAKVVYHLGYRVKSADPVDEFDLSQFALGNGAYNSWPFARELMYSLTARLGFSPYVLPVLVLRPRRVADHSAEDDPSSPRQP